MVVGSAVLSHSFPRSYLFSVALVPGTIRKAQNLLKQYSQHGLDGKKGGSNLIPLEGPEHDFRIKHLSEAPTNKHGPLAGEYRHPAHRQLPPVGPHSACFSAGPRVS